MKQLSLATIICLTVIACSDSAPELPEDNGCIHRSTLPVTAHTINGPDLPVVNDLFARNQIDNSRFRYAQYIHDTLATLYPPYAKYEEKLVKVDQYTNNLRVFTGQMGYLFRENNFHSRSGNLVQVTSSDTSQQLTLGNLRALFLANIQQFDQDRDKFRDSCFKAEFGYYDLNAGTGYATENVVKAWRVTPQGVDYPAAYYQDNGKLIYYDNGIRTFNE